MYVYYFLKDVGTHQKIAYNNFREGQGRGSSTCVFILTRTGSTQGKWGSAQCSDQSPRRVCTLCEFYTKKTKFTLRGLCNDSRHDRVFTLERLGTGKPFFKGLSTSIIKWVSIFFISILPNFAWCLVIF